MEGLVQKRILLFYLCKIIILVLFIVFSNTSFAAANEKWNMDEIEQKLFTENGHQSVLQQFQRDQKEIEKTNPALYHYLEGVNQVVANNFQRANSSFQIALSISKTENRVDIEIATLKQLVFLADYYADSGSLVDYGSRLQEIAKRNDDDKTQMLAYHVLALSFFYLANDEKVVEYLEKMILIANEHDDPMYQAIYKTLHGEILLSYEENEKALALYEEADQLYAQVEGFNAEGLKRANKASLLLAKSKIPEQSDSNAILKEMDQLIRETMNQYHHTAKLGYLYNRKGLIEQQYGLTQKAVKSFEKFKELSEKVIHFDNRMDSIRYASVNLAQAYYENANYRQAADLYVSVSKMDQNPQTFINIDEMTSKVREFTEKELNEQIHTLTKLKEAQKKALIQQRIMIFASILGIIFITIAFIIKRREHKKVNELKNSLYVQSVTDGLTGLYNRKKIFEILYAQEKDCIVALADIDNFKSINDTYGYLFGDEVIKKVVQIIREELREEDDIGRYGGEEFLLILRNYELEDALSLLESIRKNVEKLVWDYDGFKTTICIGAAKKSETGAEEIFRLVDSLVHEAKRTGKNKIIYK